MNRDTQPNQKNHDMNDLLCHGSNTCYTPGLEQYFLLWDSIDTLVQSITVWVYNLICTEGTSELRLYKNCICSLPLDILIELLCHVAVRVRIHWKAWLLPADWKNYFAFSGVFSSSVTDDVMYPNWLYSFFLKLLFLTQRAIWVALQSNTNDSVVSWEYAYIDLLMCKLEAQVLCNNLIPI